MIIKQMLIPLMWLLFQLSPSSGDIIILKLVGNKCYFKPYNFDGIVPTRYNASEEIDMLESDQCVVECIFREHCLMVFYSLESSRCFLYNYFVQPTDIVKSSRGIVVNLTSCADLPTTAKCSAENIGDRCPGHWVLHPGKHMLSGKYPRISPYKVHRNLYRSDCLSKCLEQDECGLVSFNDTLYERTCALYAYYLADIGSIVETNVSKTTDNGVLRWECCPSHQYQPSPTCQLLQTKSCKGKWTPTTLQLVDDSTTYFQSPSANQCQDTCLHNPQCSAFSFNSTQFICYQFSEAEIRRNLITTSAESSTLSGYKWDCCDGDSEYPFNACYELKLPQANNLFVLSVSCETEGGTAEPQNASRVSTYYQLIDRWQPVDQYVDLTTGGNTRFRIGAYHADKSLEYLTLMQFKTVANVLPNFQCLAMFGVNHQPRLISRDDWLAGLNWTNGESFSKTPAVVIILNTLSPTVLLVDTRVCSTFVRHYQQFHRSIKLMFDIGYNFLVCGDGNVYVGRGANKVGAHTNGRNYESIGIGVIGDFSSHPPSTNMLRAIEWIINDCVKQGYLRPNYVLLGHKDLDPTSNIPQPRLYMQLPTLSHYNSTVRYGLCQPKMKMSPAVRYSIYVATFSVLLILLIGSWIGYRRYSTSPHQQFCRVFRKYLSQLASSETLTTTSCRHYIHNERPGNGDQHDLEERCEICTIFMDLEQVRCYFLSPKTRRSKRNECSCFSHLEVLLKNVVQFHSDDVSSIAKLRELLAQSHHWSSCASHHRTLLIHVRPVDSSTLHCIFLHGHQEYVQQFQETRNHVHLFNCCCAFSSIHFLPVKDLLSKFHEYSHVSVLPRPGMGETAPLLQSNHRLQRMRNRLELVHLSNGGFLKFQ